MLICRNPGFSDSCDHSIGQLSWHFCIHQTRYACLPHRMVGDISLQSCPFCSVHWQLADLVFTKWPSHVPDFITRLSFVVYWKVKRRLWILHLSWTVGFKFLVIIHRRAFVVWSLYPGIKCSTMAITMLGLWIQTSTSLQVSLSV